MNKIYIEFEPNGFVTMQHFMPFDVIQGVKNAEGAIKTEEELCETGALVDSIPVVEPANGKEFAGLFYDPITKELRNEYKDKPLTLEEKFDLLSTAFDEFVFNGGVL